MIGAKITGNGSVVGVVSTKTMKNEINCATHFDQPGSPYGLFLPPYIAAAGCTYIRDNVNWINIEHTGQGVYGLWTGKTDWMNAAHAAGLKIVAIVDAGGNQSSTFYTDKFDPVGLANACAWLAVQKDNAGNPLVDVIEFLNEPNNTFASNYGGHPGIVDASGWQQKYVDRLNAVYAAVKAVAPNTPVIGLGAQGKDVLYMLSLKPTLDGITYHPYDDGSGIPERAYEPGFIGYPSYEAWVAAVRAAAPGVPIWETERNGDRGQSEYASAVWNGRRILMSWGMNVEHSFIYEFISTDSMQAVLDFTDHPRQVLFVIQRLQKALAGLVSTGQGVGIAVPPVNFKSYVFSGTSEPVAAVWIGNVAPAKLPETGGTSPVSASFNIPGSQSKPSALLDVISGYSQPILSVSAANPNSLPQWADSIGTLKNIPVSGQPRLVVPAASGGGVDPSALTYKKWLTSLHWEMVKVCGVGPTTTVENWMKSNPITPG